MKLLLLSIHLLFCCLSSVKVNAQAYTTVSKSCGSCGGAVSSSSRIGQRCPHCGVIWGRENTHKSSHRSSASYSEFDNTVAVEDGNMFQMSNTIVNCNLRSAPNSKSSILGQIGRNQSITITQRKGNWVKIRFFGSLMGDEQYSMSSYVGWVQIGYVVL